jgi:tetratricopeptide (TPR) repeat protein
MQRSAAFAGLFICGLHVSGLLGGALLGAGTLALAQDPPHAVPESTPMPDGSPALGQEPGPGALGEELGPPDGESSEAARQAHLDSLFETLADAENEHWERTQAQIYAVWNRSGSASMDLLAERADKAVAEQDYDTALIHLNDLTRLAPGFPEGWNKRATVYFLRDEYGRSLADISRVLALEPRHFGAYSGLGIILDRLGDKKGALEAYRRAVAINPHLPGAEEGIRKLTREVEGERL